VILTQELCTVCAPSFTSVTRAARLLDAAVRVVSLEPRGIQDVLDNIQLVADLAGVAARGREVVAELTARLDAATARGRAIRPRVAVVEWLDPIYVGGHWVPEMVAVAGGRDVLGTAGAPSRTVPWQDVRDARPEVLVVAPCGFDVARARAEMHLMTARAGWDDLPAVRQGHVYVVDASSYFSRPGPRLVNGVEILAALLGSETATRGLALGAAERFVG
ncbi:MAG TPA: ABC transporter substrate-binding protein, partial [bacterium]|nr:ABC transporter substrate-binding protein [bacterium]